MKSNLNRKSTKIISSFIEWNNDSFWFFISPILAGSLPIPAFRSLSGSRFFLGIFYGFFWVFFMVFWPSIAKNL